jgi:four helix bundle protein
LAVFLPLPGYSPLKSRHGGSYYVLRPAKRGAEKVMSVNSFRDLDAWQVAMDFVETIYRTSAGLPPGERYGLCSQLRRAAVSVPSNIAEGHATKLFGRNRHHLRIACGSLAEISTQLELACRLGYLSREECSSREQEIERLNQLVRGLLRSVTSRMGRGWTSATVIVLLLR